MTDRGRRAAKIAHAHRQRCEGEPGGYGVVAKDPERAGRVVRAELAQRDGTTGEIHWVHVPIMA